MIHKILVRYLPRFGEPSEKDVASAVERAWDKLQPEAAQTPVATTVKFERQRGWRLPVLSATAATAAGLLILIAMDRAPAVAEITEGGIVGGRIEIGEVLRSTDAGAVVTLADTSRVELRPQTDFSIERRDDGLLIRLNKGSLIVHAAKQLAGHLYVQTKDVTVSVVGTVFLVNAEEEGSRVAVIEGEVHVQQGATSKTLLQGEQLATNPIMQTVPVIEEILWSRNASAHMALLQQAVVVPVAVAPANPAPPYQSPAAEERVAFEVASVRPSGPAPVAGGRGGGPAGTQPCAATPQLSPGRFVITRATLYRLVALAYGKRCTLLPGLEIISGGPEWTRSDRFDVEGVFPEGSPVYTRSQLQQGEAPRLQRMLQTLLAERFKLTVRHETREMPIYNLVVETAGKIKLSEDQTLPPDVVGPFGGFGGQVPRGLTWTHLQGMTANDVPMSNLAAWLVSFVNRPVFDKTELKGLFDIRLQMEGVFTTPGRLPAVPAIDFGSQVFSALQEQLGLKLESARGPVEFLVIEQVEKPSEN